MMSDDDFCYFDNDYVYDTDDDSDDHYYFDDDDHSMYMSGGYYDNDDMDDDDMIITNDRKTNQISDPDQMDRKQVYKELDIFIVGDVVHNPPSLIDICSRRVALLFPFAYLEDRDPPIPDNIQLKVMKHSFPQSMEKIKRYCVLNNGSSTEFERAIRIVKNVKDMKQIGFHLSASIEMNSYRSEILYRPPGKKTPNLYVTIKFDRGMITEMNCPCENSSSWCSHVIAVCIVRIFRDEECVYKPPLSDSLNHLKSYAQLRTFTQYLIAEFCDGRIIESAQNVLDRMLTPRTEENDAIGQTWGAPDPTAGPGIEESAKWLVCEEGLKSRCVTLIHNSDVTEGCWATNISDIGNQSSVMEWWRTFQLEKPVVDGYFCEFFSEPGTGSNAQFSYNFYRHSYSREKSQEITKFLQTCEDIVKDDFDYSLKAVQTFTTKLLENLEQRNQRESYRYEKKVFESNFHLGCIPSPQQCWLFRDQLARLWRLLVLNPFITDRKREEIFTIMTKLPTITPKLNDKSTNARELMSWDSPEHISQLRFFSWKSLELGQGPFKTGFLAEVRITQCVVMETQRYASLESHVDDVRDHFSYPVSLTCGTFSSSVAVYCYIIEALLVYGEKEQAVHLALVLALALVRYYSAWIEFSLRVTVKDSVFVNWDDDEAADRESESSKHGKKSKRGNARKRARKGAKKVENIIAGKQALKEALFKEDTGVIPITCFAYLVHVLVTNVGMVGDMLKLVKLQNKDEYSMEVEEYTNDEQSLIFRLGVIGLAMPKIQAPSLQLQVEWFNWEVYIADKMASLTVGESDLSFLQQITARLISLSVIRYSPRSYLPPYTLIMTLFNHMYENGVDGVLSNSSDEVLTVALETVEAPTRTYGARMQQRLFFETCRRHWAKLVETVIHKTSTNEAHLKKALQSVFKANGMIGSPNDQISTVLYAGTKKATHLAQKTAFINHMIPEKVVAALYLSHTLVEKAEKIRLDEVTANAAKQNTNGSPGKLDRKTFETLIVDGRKMLVKDQPISDERRALYESAIKIGTYAFAVKNNALKCLKLESYSIEYNFPEFLQRNLRWLCRLSTKIQTKAFELLWELHKKTSRCFTDDEVLRLCTQMLESEQKRDDKVWIMVRDVFLALMKDEHYLKISSMLQLCRNVEKEAFGSREILIPAFCKEILIRMPKASIAQALKFEYLIEATKLMHKMSKDEDEGDHEILSCLNNLFADSSDTSSVGSGHEEAGPSGDLARLPLNEFLKLSFELALEAVTNITDNEAIRGYESRRRFESLCEIVTFIAQKTSATKIKPLGVQTKKIGYDFPDFEEVYVSRLVEVLCNTVKDCLLLTDFFFEIASRLLVLPQHGSFGRDKVLLSDDHKLDMLCKSCSSLSVLLQRCIAGLIEAIQGDTMKNFLKVKVKDASQDGRNRLKSIAKHDRFYYNSSLVAVLEVLRRLMNLTEGDQEDFESLSYKIAAKNALLKTAIDELNAKASNNSPRSHEIVPEELISSLLLRRMFSPALAGFDYDSDTF